MKSARALDRIAEYAELPLEDFVRERRLQAQQSLVETCKDIRHVLWKKQIAVIDLFKYRGNWDDAFDLDFNEEQKMLDELKTLTERIRSDTVLIEAMEGAHEPD